MFYTFCIVLPSNILCVLGLFIFFLFCFGFFFFNFFCLLFFFLLLFFGVFFIKVLRKMRLLIFLEKQIDLKLLHFKTYKKRKVKEQKKRRENYTKQSENVKQQKIMANWFNVLTRRRLFYEQKLENCIHCILLQLVYHRFHLLNRFQIVKIALISPVGRVFTNGPGDLGSIPGRIIL